MRFWKSAAYAGAAAAVMLFMDAPVAQEQAPAARRATPQSIRMPDGKPNLTGLWQTTSTADWDIQDHSAQAGPFYQLDVIGAIPLGQGIVEGGEIPYLPAALVKRIDNLANCWKTRSGHWEGNTVVVENTNFNGCGTAVGPMAMGAPRTARK